MKITILGTGNIGSVLGRKWAAAGNDVVFGSRLPHTTKVQAVLTACGERATALEIPEAIAAGEMVLFAIPWVTVEDVAWANAEALAGKLLVDATNRFFSEGPVNNLANLHAAVPDAKIYRAFNTLGWEVFDAPNLDGQKADLFYTGPAGDGQDVMERRIREVGLRPVWLGENERAGLVDNLGALWVTLVFRQGWDRRFMFKLVQDENPQ